MYVCVGVQILACDGVCAVEAFGWVAEHKGGCANVCVYGCVGVPVYVVHLCLYAHWCVCVRECLCVCVCVCVCT